MNDEGNKKRSLAITWLAFSLTVLAGVGCVSNDAVASQREEKARLVQLINRDWNFYKGSRDGAESVTFDDASWEKVGIPHSASIPYWIEQVEVYEGDAWYRKNFTMEPTLESKRVFVEFEGAFQHAWVYLNGKLLGENKGGFTGFCYDMTPYLKFDGENVLAVRVKNGWDATIAPRAGDSIFPNGLNRNVRLIATGDQHVDWLGQFVSTPKVSRKSATVRVETEIRNHAAAEADCSVLVEVVAKDGTVVTQGEQAVKLPPGKVTPITQELPEIEAPNLWSPDSPYLYTVRTQIKNGEKVVDEYEERLGVRWFEFTLDKGFFLNGEHLFLYGYNVHEDRAGWAFAGTDAAMYRDMQMMKDVGSNCIRAAHNPHPRGFYRACDEIGLLVWDELQFWGRGGFGKRGKRVGGEEGTYMADAYPAVEGPRAEFEKNLKDNFRTMIRAHRNHPSVLVWSLGNEVVMQMPKEVRKETERLFHELNDLSHKLDPTRPTGMGNGVRGLTDVEGFNASNPKQKTGDRPIMTTETKLSLPRPREPWRSGALFWSGFDYGTHCVNWRTGKSFGPVHGLFDHHRLFKGKHPELLPEGHPDKVIPEEGTPAELSLAADKTVLRNDGTDDSMLIISVLDKGGKRISNNVPVILKIVAGPGVLPTGREWKTNTAMLGRQAIEFRSYEAGRTVIEVTSPGLKPARVEIRTTAAPGARVTI